MAQVECYEPAGSQRLANTFPQRYDPSGVAWFLTIDFYKRATLFGSQCQADKSLQTYDTFGSDHFCPYLRKEYSYNGLPSTLMYVILNSLLFASRIENPF